MPCDLCVVPPHVEPFSVSIPDTTIDNILQRVRSYDWGAVPDTGEGWNHGTGKEYMQQLCKYWTEQYSWKHARHQLNQYPQYTTTFDDIQQTLHFVWLRESYHKGTPRRALLLVNGWPSTFYEYYRCLPMLLHAQEDNASAMSHYDIVVASLPGYTFSGKPPHMVGTKYVADVFHRLLTERLGYTQYVVHGSDWGSDIAPLVAQAYPQHCVGIHLTMFDNLCLSDEVEAVGDHEQQWKSEYLAKMETESPYAALQSTRPMTLAYAATEPVFVAAWLLEKYAQWSDIRWHTVEQQGGAGNMPTTVRTPLFGPAWSVDDLLTNIMLYCVTQSFATSTWLYRGTQLEVDESQRNNVTRLKIPLTVPCGLSAFPDPCFNPPPYSMLQRVYSNIVSYRQPAAGGHFAATEQPELFAQELEHFLNKLGF